MALPVKVLIAASALSFLALSSAPSFAATKEACEAMFDKADKDHDGTLSQMEDPKWQQRIDHMSDINKKDVTIIQKDQFMTSCMRGEMDGM